jgi:hypothetical protein
LKQKNPGQKSASALEPKLTTHLALLTLLKIPPCLPLTSPTTKHLQHFRLRKHQILARLQSAEFYDSKA